MKRFISTLILAICSQIIHAKDLAYLKGMPSPDAVIEQVKGDNPLHTYTRQTGALFRLKLWIINGEFGGYSAKAAPQEQALIDKYDNATKQLRQEYIGKYGAMSAQQQKEWTRLVNDYAYNDEVKEILVARLLTHDVRKNYEARHKQDTPAVNEPSSFLGEVSTYELPNWFTNIFKRLMSIGLFLFGCHLFSKTNGKLRLLAKERFNNNNAFPTFEQAEAHQRSRVMTEYTHLASWVIILFGFVTIIFTWAVQ